jgi:hypothetical protein
MRSEQDNCKVASVGQLSRSPNGRTDAIAAAASKGFKEKASTT